MDRRQIQNVDDVDVIINENSIEIDLISNNLETPDIELWGADRRKAMLEEALNFEIIFKNSVTKE